MPQVSLEALIAGARSGEFLVSFPTDTVPALAVRPDRADLIFQAKQRSMDKPLIWMAGAIADIWPAVVGSPEALQIWQRVAQRHWPGALTLVLPASQKVPPAMNPTNPVSIGVRVPNHPLAQRILQETGPLATTSVNRSGEPPLMTMAEISVQFPEILTPLPSELDNWKQDQIMEGKENACLVSGTPSTVARWTGIGWEILRQGAVLLDDLD